MKLPPTVIIRYNTYLVNISTFACTVNRKTIEKRKTFRRDIAVKILFVKSFKTYIRESNGKKSKRSFFLSSISSSQWKSTFSIHVTETSQYLPHHSLLYQSSTVWPFSRATTFRRSRSLIAAHSSIKSTTFSCINSKSSQWIQAVRMKFRNCRRSNNKLAFPLRRVYDYSHSETWLQTACWSY